MTSEGKRLFDLHFGGSISKFYDNWKQPKIAADSVPPECKLHNKDTFIGIEVELECVPHLLGHTASEVQSLDNVVQYMEGLASSTKKSEAMKLAIFYKLWKSISDHSLRGENAKEFLFRVPYKGDAVSLSVQTLGAVFSGLGEHTLPSSRCSVHIHVNTLDLLYEEFLMLLVLYVIYEPVLFAYCGHGRRSNIYCTPVADCSESKQLIAQAIHTYKSLADTQGYAALTSGWSKYRAINIGNDKGAMGTIEYRHLNSTTDATTIINWINLLLAMQEAAVTLVRQGYSFDDVVDRAASDPLSFTKKIFYKKQLAILMENGSESLLWDGARSAVEIVYGIRSITNIDV